MDLIVLIGNIINDMPLIIAIMPSIFMNHSSFDAGLDQISNNPMTKGRMNSAFAGFIRRV
ncbi:MAG: hypothetical protein WC312_04335 [Candidatus Omnitrophota bacterium]|jgi:hypothetical protein